MTQLAFLDLVPVLEGTTPTNALTTALSNAADIARHCEDMGYSRYWVAEHHGMRGIGSAATSVVLAHIGGATRHIRIGSGGIMLPNHAPLQIAEQFGTLEALFPGRVDLGLGRAPGSDGRVAMALRRGLNSNPDNFVQEVLELQACFAEDPRLGFVAIPGAGAVLNIWILGSSLYGAQVAAALGLPYAFASHFAAGLLDQALAVYRQNFRPSAVYPKPHAMVACNIYAADSMEEAAFQASSMQQSMLALRTGRLRNGFTKTVAGYYESLSAPERQILDSVEAVGVAGTQATVAEFLTGLINRTAADEIIITSPIHDHAARKHSITLAAQAAKQTALRPLHSA